MVFLDGAPWMGADNSTYGEHNGRTWMAGRTGALIHPLLATVPHKQNSCLRFFSLVSFLAANAR